MFVRPFFFFFFPFLIHCIAYIHQFWCPFYLFCVLFCFVFQPYRSWSSDSSQLARTVGQRNNNGVFHCCSFFLFILLLFLFFEDIVALACRIQLLLSWDEIHRKWKTNVRKVVSTTCPFNLRCGQSDLPEGWVPMNVCLSLRPASSMRSPFQLNAEIAGGINEDLRWFLNDYYYYLFWLMELQFFTSFSSLAIE